MHRNRRSNVRAAAIRAPNHSYSFSSTHLAGVREGGSPAGGRGGPQAVVAGLLGGAASVTPPARAAVRHLVDHGQARGRNSRLD